MNHFPNRNTNNNKTRDRRAWCDVQPVENVKIFKQQTSTMNQMNNKHAALIWAFK